MKNRVIALVLALALCLSLPLAVSALGPDDFRGGRPSGLCEAEDGALLVTDVYNKVIWRVQDGKAEIFAGVIGAADVSGEPVPTFFNDAADKAFFMEPWDIKPFLQGYAVTDTRAHALRYIQDGVVCTLTGVPETAGHLDGRAEEALFDSPTGLALDAGGALYIADTGNGAIRRLEVDGTVTTVATDLDAPTALCWCNGSLYVAETGRSRIVRIVNGRAIPFAGVSEPAEDEGEYYGGYVDAPLERARFDHPQGLAAGADGTLYVSDAGNSSVRAIRDGRVYTLLRGASLSTSPAGPRGMLVRGETLTVADRTAGTLLTLSVSPKTFSDLAPDAWYLAAVESAVRNGIADGTGGGRFEPNAPMNRAMFVTMLSRLHLLRDGAAVIDGDASFADVPENEWYAAPVRWAADRGIVLGGDDGFAPLRGISRQELAVMLYRYAQTQGMDVSSAANALDVFSDAAAASDWAEAGLRWACAKGVLRGDGEGHLNPNAPATRAQALTMLLNFMNAYEF